MMRPEQPNNEYVIEEGIPIPKSGRGRARGGKSDAIRRLAVGQSVYFPGTTVAMISALWYRINFDGPRPKFTARTIDGGVRVWRLK